MDKQLEGYLDMEQSQRAHHQQMTPKAYALLERCIAVMPLLEQAELVQFNGLRIGLESICRSGRDVDSGYWQDFESWAESELARVEALIV